MNRLLEKQPKSHWDNLFTPPVHEEANVKDLTPLWIGLGIAAGLLVCLGVCVFLFWRFRRVHPPAMKSMTEELFEPS